MDDSKQHKGSDRGAIAYMARNSIAANLLMVILIGAGVWTMYNIQKEVFPDFQLDIVEVNVVYPGAAPTEVEQGILLPVEEAVRGVQGIKEITSTADEGSGEVMIELVAGTNRMKAFQDIDQAPSQFVRALVFKPSLMISNSPKFPCKRKHRMSCRWGFTAMWMFGP